MKAQAAAWLAKSEEDRLAGSAKPRLLFTPSCPSLRALRSLVAVATDRESPHP